MRPLHRQLLLVLLLAWARPAAAQQAAPPAAGATISGVVMDSIAGAPLAAATVQLVAAGGQTDAARTATTDSAGGFSFTAVPEGRWALGFFHAALDSLGLEPIVRGVTVAGQAPVRADLAIPSLPRLKAALCPGNGAGGVILGIVLAARGGAPVRGATVLGEWQEYSIGRREMSRTGARRTAVTAENGGFVLCDVPAPGTVMLQVVMGADSTDRIESDVSERGFLRRDFYLGEARLVTRADGARPDSVPPVRVRTGAGRLSGTVLTSDARQPLPGAVIGVVNGETTRTNARGEWTLDGAPLGTRVLEVRATGYYPVRRAVDVADGAPPVHVTLSKAAAVLDTLRVTARARSFAGTGGFDERRRSSGAGRFLTPEDIARRRPLVTSDLFHNFPGLLRERTADGNDAIYMKSGFGDRCTPAVYLNGTMMRNLRVNDIDEFVPVERLAAIEVYQESQTPPQFQEPMGGCGSVVVWTK